MTATLLDLRNSGDTAGSRDRVVGYGSFLFDAEGGLFDAKGSEPRRTTACS